MGDRLLNSTVGIITAIIGVAIDAIIFAKSSNTALVFTSAGNFFSKILGAILGPVSKSSFSVTPTIGIGTTGFTGGSTTINL